MAADVQETGSSSQKDLDADQIQNLINMALSNAYDTVSSWLQPPSAAVIAADEKLRTSNQEFEKMVFRPVRLGVGATAPTASTPKDVYKLKHKLAGTKRKADEIDSVKGKEKAKQDAEDEDDEDSKSQSVSKKPKLGGASGLLAFEPTEPDAKPKRKKKKKKKKDKGLLELGTMASPEDDAVHSGNPGPSSTSSRTLISEPSASKQLPETGGIPETSRQGPMTETTEAVTGPVGPAALPSDVREKKRKKKKKKRKSSSGEHGGNPGVFVGVDDKMGKDQDQGGLKHKGDEWLGISLSLPPPGSDMGGPKPSVPTGIHTPDLKYTTTHDSRIHRHHSSRPTVSSASAIPVPSAAATIPVRSAPPFLFPPLSPPPNWLASAESDLSASASLPTLPNGDSSSPHKKKKKKKRAHLLTQAQALDEQSSEATFVSSSDHTARMTSPREEMGIYR